MIETCRLFVVRVSIAWRCILFIWLLPVPIIWLLFGNKDKMLVNQAKYLTELLWYGKTQRRFSSVG
jgi:hypothetical protein